jgi:pyrroloquinoline quinone (PQQ) biosynthesis protein C
MKDRILSIAQALEKKPNPFFESLKKGAMSKTEFAETQVQFFWAVTHFHRPMRVLSNRFDDPESQNLGLRNVNEELGDGDPQQSHTHTFLRFLKRLDGLEEWTVRERPIWPEVLAFNQSLDRVCGQHPVFHAAAMMGMIELLFSRYSGEIGSAVVNQGWLEKEALVHYSTHESLDLRHAQEFFSVAERGWPSESQIILAGLEQGATLLNGLYRDLFSQCQNRIRQ